MIYEMFGINEDTGSRIFSSNIQNTTLIHSSQSNLSKNFWLSVDVKTKTARWSLYMKKFCGERPVSYISTTLRFQKGHVQGIKEKEYQRKSNKWTKEKTN